jgi:ferredoxin-thioredoxin reductase catalytic subunit
MNNNKNWRVKGSSDPFNGFILRLESSYLRCTCKTIRTREEEIKDIIGGGTYQSNRRSRRGCACVCMRVCVAEKTVDARKLAGRRFVQIDNM